MVEQIDHSLASGGLKDGEKLFYFGSG